MKNYVIFLTILLFGGGSVFAEGAKSGFLIEYSVHGGFTGGTHYALVATDQPDQLRVAKGAKKIDSYLINIDAIPEFEALLQKHGIETWKSPPPGRANDTFDTHFKVTTPKMHCDLKIVGMPTEGVEVQKRLDKLIEELKDLVEKRGRRIEVK